MTTDLTFITNSKEIREKVLKYLLVRRTRNDILQYFGEDLKKQNLKFPDVEEPESLFYELNEEEDSIFNRTMELIIKDFKYTPYMPLMYYKGELKAEEVIAQKNMGKFIKILLVKRLESSFYAFKKTLERFIWSYERIEVSEKIGQMKS